MVRLVGHREVEHVDIWDGEEHVGKIEPREHALAIVSVRVQNRMGLTYIEVQEPAALVVTLGKAVPELLRSMQPRYGVAIDHEQEFADVVQTAVSGVHRAIWGNNSLTGTEQRLAWMLVLQELLQSAMIDAQSNMIRERFIGK